MNDHAFTESHPIAHIALEDNACRDAVVDTLHRRGWSVIEHRTGLHLIHAISGLILGDRRSHRPELIVADAAARGCSGLSIAHGLRDLGSRIPVVVVARAADELAATQSGPLTIVAPENAARTVALLARPQRSSHGNPSSQQSASA
jgi:FixJ family two-component response regulator